MLTTTKTIYTVTIEGTTMPFSYDFPADVDLAARDYANEFPGAIIEVWRETTTTTKQKVG